jgi:hypothetical protein
MVSDQFPFIDPGEGTRWETASAAPARFSQRILTYGANAGGLYTGSCFSQGQYFRAMRKTKRLDTASGKAFGNRHLPDRVFRL